MKVGDKKKNPNSFSLHSAASLSLSYPPPSLVPLFFFLLLCSRNTNPFLLSFLLLSSSPETKKGDKILPFLLSISLSVSSLSRSHLSLSLPGTDDRRSPGRLPHQLAASAAARLPLPTAAASRRPRAICALETTTFGLAAPLPAPPSICPRPWSGGLCPNATPLTADLPPNDLPPPPRGGEKMARPRQGKIRRRRRRGDLNDGVVEVTSTTAATWWGRGGSDGVTRAAGAPALLLDWWGRIWSDPTRSVPDLGFLCV